MSPEKNSGYPKWIDGKRIDGPTLEDLRDPVTFAEWAGLSPTDWQKAYMRALKPYSFGGRIKIK
jgi:hypothetical protein